jgi:hypothetical protein
MGAQRLQWSRCPLLSAVHRNITEAQGALQQRRAHSAVKLHEPAENCKIWRCSSLISGLCLIISKITYIYTYLHTYIHTYVHTYIHTYLTYIHIWYMHTTYKHTYMRTFKYIHLCSYIHIHVYTDTYIHTYIRTYVRTYVHTYIHTYTHTKCRCWHRYHLLRHLRHWSVGVASSLNLYCFPVAVLDVPIGMWVQGFNFQLSWNSYLGWKTFWVLSSNENVHVQWLDDWVHVVPQV